MTIHQIFFRVTTQIAHSFRGVLYSINPSPIGTILPQELQSVIDIVEGYFLLELEIDFTIFPSV